MDGVQLASDQFLGKLEDLYCQFRTGVLSLAEYRQALSRVNDAYFSEDFDLDPSEPSSDLRLAVL